MCLSYTTAVLQILKKCNWAFFLHYFHTLLLLRNVVEVDGEEVEAGQKKSIVGMRSANGTRVHPDELDCTLNAGYNRSDLQMSM